MTQEALKLALEALNWSTPHEGAVITHGEAIAAIKAALAQPAQQEPVLGVVIREGLPTLLQERNIKPTDTRLYATTTAHMGSADE